MENLPILLEESLPAAQLQRQVEQLGHKIERIEEVLQSGQKGLLDYMRVKPDKFISKYFEHLPDNPLYEAMYSTSEPLRNKPAYTGMKLPWAEKCIFHSINTDPR